MGELQKQNILQDRFDGRRFAELLNETRPMQQSTKTDATRALGQDIWAAYFKAVPELQDVDKPYDVNRPIVDRVLESQDYMISHGSTTYDETLSMVCAIGTMAGLVEEMENRPELKRNYEKQNTEAMEGLDLRRAVSNAVSKGKVETAEAMEALSAWGIGKTDLETRTMAERLDLIKKLKNPRMKKAADLIGRMRNLAYSKRKSRVHRGRDEVSTVTLGNDLSSVVSTELIGLVVGGKLEDEFDLKFIQSSLLQFEYRGKAALGRGPMVVLIDKSGSMSFDNRIAWANAVGIAMVEIAQKQGRSAYVRYFNDSLCETFEFVKKEKNYEKYMGMAVIDTSGNTSFEEPLQDAIDKLKETEWKNGDIVMITDGYAKVSEEFLAQFLNEKETRRFSCYSVVIGETAELPFVDRAWGIDELSDDVAGELFEAVEAPVRV